MGYNYRTLSNYNWSWKNSYLNYVVSEVTESD